MDKVVVKVSDLLAKAKELSEANMKYVSLMALESDDFDEDDVIPAALHFTALESKDSFMSIDFEDIELVTDIDF